MTQPGCDPQMNVMPIPCGNSGGESPGGPVEVAGCCSPALATATWCDGDQVLSVLLQSTCAECGDPAGSPAIVGWYGPGGAFNPGPPPAGAEPCSGQLPDPSPAEPCASSTELLVLCDRTADSCSKFLRLMVISCDGQVTETTDLTVTGQPYTAAGEPGDCDACPCEDNERVLPLCDHLPDGEIVQFLRHIVVDCETGQILEQTDLHLDNQTPYEVQGEVGNCPCAGGTEPCEPPAMCQGLVGLSEGETWTPPPGTESINLSVVCAPVTVYPCTGDTGGVVINECGSLSWSAPGGPCAPGSFCDEFRIDVPAGSAAYISYLVAGCDESPGESP